MKPYKICCLTYKHLDRLVKEALRHNEDPSLDITIVEGLQGEIIKELNQAEADGCEVVVGGGANARIAREVCGIPVLEYQLTAYDYLDAIEKAFALREKIAICTYRVAMEGELRRYLERRGSDFVNIVYETDDDLRGGIREHSDRVVIGAAHAVDLAESLGCASVSIYPGEAAVLEALHSAKSLAEQIRRQSEKSKFADAVIQNSANGLVLTDHEGRIIDFNAAAAQVFGKKPAAVKGRNAAEALPDGGLADFRRQKGDEQTWVRKIRGEDVLCKWVRLTGRLHDEIGAVGIFTPMSDIIKAQLEYTRRLREEQRDRGFSAKMSLGDIVGASAAIKHAKEEARLFARSDASVLIRGETGVGKEIFAQSIHNDSARKNGPFIAINCAALPENLLESELFGYDEGAFTGGKRGGKKGLFEYADKGSIFLDEIAELPPALQSRLLRVLQEREIMHVGGERVIPVDVRVLAATNKDIEACARDFFREDLYYRLNVLELHLPPLRDRQGDARELFATFLRAKSSFNLRLEELPAEMIRIIDIYGWPGNIRELQNVCERFALYLENGTERGAKFLRRSLIRAIGEERLLGSILAKCSFPGKDAGADLVAILQDALGYNKARIGEILGVSRTTLWRMQK